MTGPDTTASLAEWAKTVLLAGRKPGQTLTKAEHDALMANRDRPLTQQPIQRHQSGGAHNLTGEYS